MTRRAARPMRKSRTTDRGRAGRLAGVLSGARVAGLVLVLATAGGIGWLITDDRFGLDADAVTISGLQYTDATAAHDALAIPAGAPNVFLLKTDAMRRTLLRLPSVAAADVRIVLPDQLLVSVTEHAAVLQVVHDGVTYLLDADGVVLEGRPANAPVIAELPLVDDHRIQLGIPLEVGQSIDQTEAGAMLRIAALTPSLVGSTATALAFSANDADGFVVTAAPDGWRAVFGFYTPTLRPPTLIAQQVQCLRSLLENGEGQIATIYLAPQGDRCGTYLPRPS